MEFKNKRAIYRNIGQIIILCFITIIIGVLPLFPKIKIARAASADLAFTTVAGVYDDVSGEWVDYVEGDVSLNSLSFKFNFTSNLVNESITEFNYIDGSSRSAVEEAATIEENWRTDGEGNEYLKPTNMDNGNFMIWNYPVSGVYDKWIKFRAVAQTTNASGQPITEEYVYNKVFHIVFDNTVLPSDIEIIDVDAQYKSGTIWHEYCTVYGESENKWISTELRFEITSKNMNLGGTIQEKFYYSIDGIVDPTDDEKEWIPAIGNICQISQNLNGTVQFKVTDQSGRYVSYYTEDINGKSIFVKMDIVLPEFSVSATSTKVVDGNNVTYNYNSSLWSYNEILYKITPVEIGESPITYQYREAGGEWAGLRKNTSGGVDTYNLSLVKTTQNIEFRAFNAANKTYIAPSKYYAYIDKVQPAVSISANDKEGTVIKSFGEEESENYRVGYASDMINFVIYNKDSEGNKIQNESEISYKYKYSYIDGEGNEQESTYKSMSRNIDDEGYYFYTFSDIVYGSEIINHRLYTFKLESKSGLFDEKSFEASVLYSDFEITVDPVSRVENEDGWANSAIPVFINAPILDKYVFAYGVSGTGYENFEKSFVWAADGSGDGDDIVKDVSEDFANLEENEVGYIEPGMAKFRIFVSTSVERRYFKVYAYNAAEIRSKNVENTTEIKLDMVIPNVNIVAKLKNSDIVLQDGEWANGIIDLTLDSKALPQDEISLSGLECELMLDERIPEKVIISDVDNDGLPIGRFRYSIEIPEESNGIYEKTFIFRLTSGSDLQNLVYFNAKIDKRDMELSYVYDERNHENLLKIEEGDDPYFTDITTPICKDITLKFFGNQEGHFSYWYRFDENNSYCKGEGDELKVDISGETTKGEIIVEFYLESFAIDTNGNYKTTNIYTIIIPFNCKKIDIQISILPQKQGMGYKTDVNNWKNGPLEIAINLPAGEEYSDYTYGILILGDLTPEEFYAENNLAIATQNSEIFYYCIPVNLNDGVFEFWGIDENGDARFSDPSYLTTKCFYKGNIIVFAFNEAKYSSNIAPLYSDEVRIDNSIPDVKDMIKQMGSDDEGNDFIIEINGEMDGNKIYNNDTIMLCNPNFEDRATIEYYYYDNNDSIPTEGPSEDSNWVKMAADDIVNIPYDDTKISTTYYLYAKNSLGKESSLSGEEFIFTIDPVIPSFEVNYPNGEGSTTETSIDGETYNVFTFTWTEEISIGFETNSNTGVYYWYSIDSCETWIKYNDIAYTEKEITFFYNEDIYKTMYFKLTNQAGSEIIYEKPAVVRIDTKRPDFSLSAEVGGQGYDGGEYGNIDIEGSLNSLNLDDNSGAWSKSSVTISINIDPENKNPSPVQYQYLVKTSKGETQYAQTPSNTIINNKIIFTTDRMDNFGKNNDAIIVVQARCPANGKVYTQAIRIKVDKVVPEFQLKGEVKAVNSNKTIKINSGEWTNQENVSISYARTTQYDNVSNVNIVYYKDNSSLENQWPMDSVTGSQSGMIISTRSESIRVLARTQSGLTYEQTFEVNIDTVPPQIESGIIVPSISNLPNTYYIDQPITYREENVKSAQYIVKKGDTVGFPLSQGHIIATNSVDNSEESKGYVKIIIEDLAGNKAELEFYMVPFELDINNLTLSQEDMDTVDRYEEDLASAKGIDDSRRAYFENLILRLRDRETTLRQEIAGFQSYLAGLSQKASYELKSDYKEMFSYLETYDNYSNYNQDWIRDAIVEGEYFDYYLKLRAEFEILNKEMMKVNLVEEETKKLPAINVVEVDDYDDVLKVYDAYCDLSPDQKSSFQTTLFNKLFTLKRKCENLLLQDEESGIKIDGNLAPGAKIEVTTYENTVELYNNAQATILDTIENDAPRTVVSISKVELTGAASQTSTGEIIVSLPIPEDYYNYVRFAVYKLSPDGSVKRINGVEIQGDGKSVEFTANSLDTYILATKANIAVREINTDTYGTLAGIELDTKMLSYIAIAVIGIFVILIVVVVITGIRRRVFLNNYNREHRNSLYKKGIRNIPKGNKSARENPYKKGERVKRPRKPV